MNATEPPAASAPPNTAHGGQGVQLGSGNTMHNNYYPRTPRGRMLLTGTVTVVLMLVGGGVGYALLDNGKNQHPSAVNGSSPYASPTGTMASATARPSPTHPITSNLAPTGPAIPAPSEYVPGVLYRIGADQNLYWSRHRRPLTGDSSWAPSAGPISTGGGWGRFRLVTADAGWGIIYGLDGKGDLYWFRHPDPLQGSGQVQAAAGIKVASGWGSYIRIMAAGEGIIYAFGGDGNLYWFEHLDPFGGKDSWTSNRQPKHVDVEWNMYVPALVAVHRGHFFAATPGGQLKYYYHNGWRDGDRDNWTYGDGGREVGDGWGKFTALIARDDGVVYAVQPNGALLWYRYDGNGDWYPGNGTAINTGWTPTTF